MMRSYSDIPAIVPGEASFGTPAGLVLEPEPPPPPPPARIYVFSILNAMSGGQPKVFDFPDTEDGRAEVASLLRGETVLAVVRGHRATVSTIAGVEVKLDDMVIRDTAVVRTDHGKKS